MRLSVAAVFSLALSLNLAAQTQTQPAHVATPPPQVEEKPAAPAPTPANQFTPLGPNAAPPAIEKTSVTHHTITIAGEPIGYTATAGTLLLRRDDDKPKASIFFISYVRDGVVDKGKRPITYTFNGGPGSSSVWLHMGAIGPKRALLKEDGSLPPAPFQLVDNENSILDVTDLVFIDPVSTGFSRPAPGEDPKQFHGVEGDLASVGDFIRLWTTRNDRWASPKFIAGESYGTTRAAGLSQYLLQNYGMYLNGITLISSVLNFETVDFGRGNDLPFILFLPSYAAVAWYHHKLAPDLQAENLQTLIQKARQFASSEYAFALMQGDQLPAADQTHIVEQIARFTGLSTDFIKRSNLRVTMGRFGKELLRDQGFTVGRYDGRMRGEDYDRAGEDPDYDPSYSVVYGPFAGTLNDYVRTSLKWESDLPYEILTGKVQPWNFAPFENRYLNMAEPLRSAITENPDLHVLVCNGFYDMATPFFATEYTFSHLGLTPKLAANVRMTYYEAGHMIYINRTSAAQLRKNLVEFYNQFAVQH